MPFACTARGQCLSGKLPRTLHRDFTAVEHAPVTDANLLFSWAGTLERLGKQDEAVDLYRRVAALNPDDLQARQKLATLSAQPAQPTSPAH